MTQQTKTRATSEMIAKHLGLSRTTVSFVLNGRAKEQRIPEKTRRRILAIAEEMGYVPNELARSLRRQKSQSIGVMVHGLGYHYVERLMLGMMPVFDREDYTSILSINYRDPARERRELMMFLQRRVDGIICLPMPNNKDLYQQLIQQGIPIVFLVDVLEDFRDVSFVVWDKARATRAAMEHLIARGRKRIGFIADKHQTVWSIACHETYREILAEAGLPMDSNWVHWEPTEFKREFRTDERVRLSLIDTVERMFKLNRTPPDALFVPTDAKALILLSVLHESAIRVPEDVMLVSLEDLFMANHPLIGLSTVAEPSEELGRVQAAETVMELIRSPGRAPIQHVIECNDLKDRRTTNPTLGAAAADEGPGSRNSLLEKEDASK